MITENLRIISSFRFFGFSYRGSCGAELHNRIFYIGLSGFEVGVRLKLHFKFLKSV